MNPPAPASYPATWCCRVTLKVWRDGAPRDLRVSLADAGDRVAAAPGDDDAAALPTGPLGLALRPLRPEEQRQADRRAALVIESVSGRAAMAGLQRGDLLLGVNGKPVNSMDAARAALAGAGRSIALLVQRDQEKIYFPV
jgi:serine protease Do